MKLLTLIATLFLHIAHAEDPVQPPQPPAADKQPDVHLEWDPNDPSEHVTGYRIYWRQQGLPIFTNNIDVVIDANGVVKTDVVINGLKQKTTYEFVVTAYNDFGESQPSVMVSWLSPSTPGKPLNLRVKVAMTTNPDGIQKIAFSLQGDPGTKAKLLASTDLIKWDVIDELTLDSDGNAELEGVIDTTANPRMFFRAEI